MEFDIIEKIALAVMCPVFASALVVFVHMTQARWEKRRDQRFWATRNADWIEQAAPTAQVRGGK